MMLNNLEAAGPGFGVDEGHRNTHREGGGILLKIGFMKISLKSLKKKAVLIRSCSLLHLLRASVWSEAPLALSSCHPA